MNKHTPSIAKAEQRVNKAEIKTLKSARRKVIQDCNKEISRINRELRKLTLNHGAVTRSTTREIEAIERRISILQGRL